MTELGWPEMEVPPRVGGWPCLWCDLDVSEHADSGSYCPGRQSQYRPVIPDRALSFQQPWAYYMMYLPEPFRKKVENRRRRNKAYCQYLWIHVSKELWPKVFEWANGYALGVGVPAEVLPKAEDFDPARLGSIIGAIKLGKPGPLQESNQGWAMQGQFPHKVEWISNRKFHVPCRGHQGVWKVPPIELDMLRALIEGSPHKALPRKELV